MAQTQVEERFGSSNDLFDNAVTTDIQRSKFDLSRKNLFTADVGMIIPIDIIPTLPNDDFDISVKYKSKIYSLSTTFSGILYSDQS